MTTEEAKEILIENLQLIQHRAHVDKDTFVSKTIATAIKALEQQPCEDCISREYLIDKIGSVDELECVENSNLFAKHYMDIVKSAPSVTPKFTDTEIQKMQELEQAQLEKAHEFGKAEQQLCDDCTVIKKLSKKYYVEDVYGYTDENIVNKVNEIIDVVNELSSVTPSRPKVIE